MCRLVSLPEDDLWKTSNSIRDNIPKQISTRDSDAFLSLKTAHLTQIVRVQEWKCTTCSSTVQWLGFWESHKVIICYSNVSVLLIIVSTKPTQGGIHVWSHAVTWKHLLLSVFYYIGNSQCVNEGMILDSVKTAPEPQKTPYNLIFKSCIILPMTKNKERKRFLIAKLVKFPTVHWHKPVIV